MMNEKQTNGLEKINLMQMNRRIAKTRKLMKPTTNYNFLKQLMIRMLAGINIPSRPSMKLAFDKSYINPLVLDFFKSLNNDKWYNQVQSILSGQNEDIVINIYELEDRNRFKKYSKGPIVYYNLRKKHPKAVIETPLKYYLKEPLSKDMLRDCCTLLDIYVIVHELSHLFDWTGDANNRKARDLYAEITPTCFESMLTEYLRGILGNNIGSEKFVNERFLDEIDKDNIRCSLRYARALYTTINFVEIMEREKKLTKDNIKKFFEKHAIHDTEYIREVFTDMLTLSSSIDYNARYPIAVLTAQEYMKLYNDDREDAIYRLDKYCERLKDGDASESTSRLIRCPVDLQEVQDIIDNIACKYQSNELTNYNTGNEDVSYCDDPIVII